MRIKSLPSFRASGDKDALKGSGRFDFVRGILAADDGQVLPLTVVALGVIMAFFALALDTAQFLYMKREMQTVADAAALAGALEVPGCNGTANCSAMQSAVQSAVKENGFKNPILVTQCGNFSVTDVTVEVNNGPCALGASDPNNGDIGYVEAIVAKSQKTFFAGVLGFPSVTIAARSEAGLSASSACVYVLNPTASNALLLNGNATLTAACGIMVDSNANPAAVFNGNDQVTASAINVVGRVLNNGNNSISPTPTTGAPFVSDPLAGLPMPTVGSCTYNNYVSNGNTNVTLSPGTYCGGTTFNGGHYTVTFNPGTYVFTGNMIANGGVSLQGTGVTLYFSSGSLTMNGNSHVDLEAPTSGTYAGMLYLQKSSDNSPVIINGDTTSAWQGTIYAPGAQLTLNGGNTTAAYTNLIVNTLIENGNDTFTIGSDYSSLPHGKNPIKGHNANLME